MTQDDDLVTLKQAFPQKMLRSAGRSRREKMQAFFNAGTQYDPRSLEEVLRFMFSNIAEAGRKLGRIDPRRSRHFEAKGRDRDRGVEKPRSKEVPTKTIFQEVATQEVQRSQCRRGARTR